MKHTWTCGNFGLGNAYGVQEFVPAKTQIQLLNYRHTFTELQLFKKTIGTRDSDILVNRYVLAYLKILQLILLKHENRR